jgi:hypothetical protein
MELAMYCKICPMYYQIMVWRLYSSLVQEKIPHFLSRKAQAAGTMAGLKPAEIGHLNF